MGFTESKEHLVEYGKKLLFNNFIQNVQGKEEFKDSSGSFYQLRVILTQTHDY
jgi:hypothetical protein